MADKTNKNEGNKDHVLLSTSLNYKVNDDNNNNDGIKCSVLNNNKFSNANNILGQELKNNFFTPGNVSKVEKVNADPIESPLLLGDYSPPLLTPSVATSSVNNKLNENFNLNPIASYSTPKSFGFLNGYQRSTEYSNEPLVSSVYETQQQYKSGDISDFSNSGNTINPNWQLNIQSSQQQQLVNYSDFVPNQAYNTSNGGLFSTHSYQYQTSNVDTNGTNNSVYQNTKSFNYRQIPSEEDFYASQSNRTSNMGNFKF